MKILSDTKGPERHKLHCIYTESAECRDCYKCVRNCDVKAIKVSNHEAVVLHDKCIYCGKCVNTCPGKAKKVRDDVFLAKKLLQSENRTILSLAPSWVAEFHNITAKQITSAAKKLGAWGVSETSLGADYLNNYLNKNLVSLFKKNGNIQIGSACPVVVEIIRKYYPQHIESLIHSPSPLGIHGRLLKQVYGDDINVIFVGPCIAKKHEIDDRVGEVDLAISFSEFEQLLDEADISLKNNIIPQDAGFIPESSGDGAFYPIDGGMIKGLNSDGVSYLSFSGLDQVIGILGSLDDYNSDDLVFMELLSCPGGCVNGPLISDNKNSVRKNIDVTAYAVGKETEIKYLIECKSEINPECLDYSAVEDNLIKQGLRSIGKESVEEELNCGGCGYDSCREMVRAMLQGNAELEMCVSYMRRLAQKKANALMKSLPFGVAILDVHLNILDANQMFASILGDDYLTIFESLGHLESIKIDSVEPISEIIADSFNMEDEFTQDIRYRERVFSVSIFPIESEKIVGILMHDITDPVLHREQIIKKAQDVLLNNTSTVQKIAYLLGENAADSEILLNSIIDSFGVEA